MQDVLISQKGIHGHYPHPNIVKLHVSCFRIWLILHTDSLIKILYYSSTFCNIIAFHTKRCKPVEHFVKISSLMLNVWTKIIQVRIGMRYLAFFKEISTLDFICKNCLMLLTLLFPQVCICILEPPCIRLTWSCQHTQTHTHICWKL